MDYSKMKQNGAWKGEDIMMNLLDGSSDSDQEPLNLPPLKGKKTTKRRKTQPYNVQPNTSVCDLCSLIKIIAVVLMISLLTLLGVLTMLLYEQLGEMRKTLDSVERKNKDSTTEVGKFQPQIDELKTTLQNVKSEESQKFSKLDGQIDTLTKSSDSIKSAMTVKSQDELNKKLEQLSQIPIISKSVAGIGSEVQNLKSQLEALNTFKLSAEKQLSDLTQKNLQSDDRESKPFVQDNGDLSKKVESLQQTVSELNITLWKKMDTMDIVLNGHQTKFEMLDNSTAHIQQQLSQRVTPVTTGPVALMPEAVKKQIETQVKQYVQEMMPNKTEDSSDSSLMSILSNMDNVTSMVKNLKDQFVQLKADHSDMIQPNQPATGDNDGLMEFKTNALERLESLNKTMDHLSHDVSTLMHKFILNQNSLTSLTRIVEGIKQYISILETKYGLKDNLTMKADDPNLANLPLAENINLNIDNQTKTDETPELTTTPRPIIFMKLVHNEKDLELGLHRWDQNGNGVIDKDEIEALGDYMPDPPSPEQVEQFDFDHNGSLDLNELKIALGYKPYPSGDERQRLADLG
ncbi:uncharacterized protein LOC127735201 isoform X2 [Mytilus californianus]|uniref:uncharacterized protein LOC127735201 isoform X2 n=1 Tax=Mytilus californianus TaxID=6549 RepID=UPI002247224B|nr:uncharacterized protein LOC127735201 isoform X2 [Mytilus californianus]